MNIVEIFHAVEQDNFTVRSLLAGDNLPQIRDTITKQPEVVALRSMLINNQRLEPAVADRINQLASATPEPGFRHPYDIAIAAYVQALYLVQSVLLPQACWVAGALPASFFARRLAFEELAALRVQSHIRTSSVSVVASDPVYSLSGATFTGDSAVYYGATFKPTIGHVELGSSGATTPVNNKASQYQILNNGRIATTAAILTSDEFTAS